MNNIWSIKKLWEEGSFVSILEVTLLNYFMASFHWMWISLLEGR